MTLTPVDVPGQDWCALAALVPRWPAPPGVQAFVTGRAGGVSRGPWGLDGELPGGLNLGAGCGDDPADVSQNRRRLAGVLPSAPHWLRQVHGVNVHVVQGPGIGVDPAGEAEADAAVTARPGEVIAVLTADCLPVFLADSAGRAVGVAHAGWRGMAAGVIENTVDALRACLPGHARGNARLHAWLGPAIGPLAFEVGEEVREAFLLADSRAAPAFRESGQPGKWFANLDLLARRRLNAAGVASIDGGGACTFSDAARFWSYRRRRESGRMASVIWIER